MFTVFDNSYQVLRPLCINHDNTAFTRWYLPTGFLCDGD